MNINIDHSNLEVFKALANEKRIEIIQLLSEDDMNISTLSERLNISRAITTRHVQQLEVAKLINSKTVSTSPGTQKICSLAIEELIVSFPKKIFPLYNHFEQSIPVGHFTDYVVKPTCGITTTDNIIGQFDNPKYFMDTARMNASLVWFAEGYLTYKFPNEVNDKKKLKMIEISLEISSEFPGSNNNWPSDISFYFNKILLGKWTSPGNYSDVRGKYNPDWWPKRNSQYGLLKTIRIYDDQTFIDGDKLSDINLNNIDLTNQLNELTIAVEPDSQYVGGLTIFGEGFGNHPQDIKVTTFYTEEDTI